MTYKQAIEFAFMYADKAIGKPIGNEEYFNDILINKIDIREIAPNNFQVFISAENPTELIRFERMLGTFLADNNISFDAEKFGLA